jgi:hypothetical protein
MKHIERMEYMKKNMKENNEDKTSAITTVRKISLAAALGLAAIGVGVLIVLAASAKSSLPESRDIFTIEDSYNMTVVVTFDVEPPIVQFIAPDGRSIDMAGIRYRPGGNFIQYFLPSAMPGTWRMTYDPLENTEISTPYSVYMAHIFIRGFAAVPSGDGDGGMHAVFEVSSDEDGEFSYKLHAVLTAADNSIESEILLDAGYGTLGEVLSLPIDTASIQETGGFMLRLTASVRHGQASIIDSAWLDLRLGAMSD